ncbi:glycerophosphodiester phosphodiesterase, partial [Streptomyces sp. NPDC059556]
MDSDTAMDPTAVAHAAEATASVTVVGHRGDPYRVRENTLESVAAANVGGGDAGEVGGRRS